jgi:hypothetical protein
VSECLNSMQLRFSIRSALALQSLWSAGHRSGAIWGNRNPHFCGAGTDLQTRASTRDLLRLRRLGGDKVTLTAYRCGPVACMAKISSRNHERFRGYREKNARRDVINVLRPLLGRCLINIRAGRFRPARKIDKIGQDIKCLVALRIDSRLFGVIPGANASD